MTEQQLDLLQFPARLPAQLGAGSPQIVGGEIRMSDGFATPPHECIHQILADRFWRAECPALAQRPKQGAIRNLALGLSFLFNE